MPLDPTQQCMMSGRYEAKNARYTPDRITQGKLDTLARSQQSKTPQQCGALAALYASALLLPQMYTVASSCKRLNQQAARTGLASIGANDGNACSGPRQAVLRDLLPTSRGHRMLRAPAALLQWPMALAQEQTKHSQFRWLNPDGALVAENESSQIEVIQCAKQFLLGAGLVTDDDAEQLEFEWRGLAAGGPLLLMRGAGAGSAQEPHFSRDKRISQANSDKQTMAHITEHCAFEADIVNARGLSEGKLLLFKAQLWDNPFTVLYQLNPDRPPSETESTIVNGVNFIVDFMTLGIKPFFASMLVAYYRSSYYGDLGDKICRRRQFRILVAKIATALDIDQSFRFRGVHKPPVRPAELQQILPFESYAPYFSHKKQLNADSELLIVATIKEKDNPVPNEVFLKPHGQFEFESANLHRPGSNRPKLRITFDEHKNSWRSLDSGDHTLMKVEIREGTTFVKIDGHKFPLQERADGQFEIQVRYHKAKTANIPVYQNPFTNDWNLGVINHHPVFTEMQQTVLKRLQVEPNLQQQYHMIDNLNPAQYGAGRMFEVRPRQDEIATTSPLYMVVEMHGRLIPVRIAAVPKKGVQYEVFDIRAPFENGHAIEWTQGVWRFETRSSPHISKSLKSLISPEMYAPAADVVRLSQPDVRGLQHNEAGAAYIKANQHYVLVQPGAISYLGSPGGKRIVVRYHKARFYPVDKYPSAPVKTDGVPTFSVVDFVELVKSMLSAKLQDTPRFIEVERKVHEMAPSGQVRVQQFASDKIDSKLFMLDMVENRLVLESALDGTKLKLLTGQRLATALLKFEQRARGGQVQHALGLKRPGPLKTMMLNSRVSVDSLADARIEIGARLIKYLLEDRKIHVVDGVPLILCEADFMGTAAFENNIFATPRAIYKAWSEYILPISRAYPDAIIAPGCFYISKDIPAYLRNKSLRYEQRDTVRALDNAINFVAVLAPVFHDGKVVAVARKGEWLTYEQKAAASADAALTIAQLRDLDISLPVSTKLHVENTRMYLGEDAFDAVDAHTGAVMAGKTLLPGERELAKQFLLADKGGNGAHNIDTLFSNEFIINGEKFIIVVEDESSVYGDSSSTVRSRVLSGQPGASDGIRYDWMLHPSAGQAVDDVVRSLADNFLQADGGPLNECSSSIVERHQVAGFSAAGKLQVFDYRADVVED